MADTLQGDARLAPGQAIWSNNGLYQVVFQNDGNLVMYAGSSAIWASNTWGRGWPLNPVECIMQQDGNLVLYGPNPPRVPVWASGTHGNDGARLVMQDDRNLVIYRTDGKPVWATGTNIPIPEKRTGSVYGENRQEVGYGKEMHSKVTLYRDGKLVVDSMVRNRNWTGGIRGRTLVVVADREGRGIWVSRIFEDPTACSVPDLSCASDRRTTHVEYMPAAVGQFAERLDIYHADNANYVDLRAEIIKAIKAAGEIAQEIKNVLNLLN